jgi:hypothetical protein
VKKAALFTLIMGMLTLATLALVMMKMGGEVRPWRYPNAYGFKNAMVWSQLVDTADELFADLGPADSDMGKEIRAKMDIGNKYDFLFMPFYSIFFASIFLYLIKSLELKEKKLPFDGKVLWAMFVCALIMWLSDVFENRQLLSLTSFAPAREVPAAMLRSLKIWTTIKWGMIFLACAAAAVYYARYFSLKRPAGIIFVLLYACSALSGALGLALTDYRSVIETTNMIIAVAWCFSIVHAGILAFSRGPREARIA